MSAQFRRVIDALVRSQKPAAAAAAMFRNHGAFGERTMRSDHADARQRPTSTAQVRLQLAVLQA